MERQIIAGKYPLVKLKGSNGLVTTCLAEDPYSGSPVVIKIYPQENPLAVEYIKASNLLADSGCPGMLMPLEGGMLENEPGYYLVFPEIPGPTLEEFFRIGGPLEESERDRMVGELESILDVLHKSGFVHLFLSPRNIFYSPGRQVFVKDPALRPMFFPFILQGIKGFDYRYFSPSLMDGAEGGPEDDVFSLSKVIECVNGRTPDNSNFILGSGSEREVWSGIYPAMGIGTASDGGDRGELLDDRREEKSSWDREHEELLDGAWEEGLSDVNRLRCVVGAAMEEVSGKRAPQGRGGIGKYVRFGAVLAMLLACCLIFYGVRPGRGGIPLDAGQVAETVAAVEENAPDTQEGEENYATGSEATQNTDNNKISGQYADAGGVNPAVEGKDYPAVDAPATRKNQRPVASFTLSPGEGTSPLRVYLDASSSHDPDGSIVSYIWSFGGNGRTLYHIFESNIIPARVGVTLTVTDNLGSSSSITRYVTLY